MRRTIRAVVLTVTLAIGLAGCAGFLESPPAPAAEPFPGITGQLGRLGITVTSWTSGDPGCDDPALSPTAIRFEAQGADQTTPVVLRIYIFRNREAWDRRLADVDRCVGAWASDPSTFEIIQTSPYVVAGQGPWPAGFAQALRDGITAAAGSGD